MVSLLVVTAALLLQWVPPAPNAVALQASVDAAIAAGTRELVIQPGSLAR